MEPDSTPGISSSSSGRTRQRLRPWLEAKINSGQFPGLYWLDRGRGVFRIKWKHGGRADWAEEDGAIFKEWAVHTGRYREGVDSPDWPSWKTRFRCALNKLPDIQELKDQSCSDEPDPYRVYKFVHRTGHGSQGSSSPEQQSAVHSSSPDHAYNSSSTLFSTRQRPSVIQHNIPSIISESIVSSSASHRQEGDVGDLQVSSLGSDLEQVCISDLLPIADNNLSLTKISVDSNINSAPEAMDTDSLKGPSYQQLSQHVTVKYESNAEANLPYYQASINAHELNLVIRYRTEVIKEVPISNKLGCRVYYGQLSYSSWDTMLYGDSSVDQVLIPYQPGHLEQTQDQLTTRLLDALELGLDIYVDKSCIYVLRRCKATVFAAPPNREEKKGIKIQRDSKPVKIFDFNNDFLPAFHSYQQGEGPRPSPQVVVAIGQNYRMDEDPYTNLLLSVTVCYPQASHLLAQHVAESPVEISRSNEYDQYVSLCRAAATSQQPQQQ